jgi:hypothetical protein
MIRCRASAATRPHPLTPRSQGAQVPRLPHGEEASARPISQESLRRLDRGIERHLDSKVGVDVLDVMMANEGGGGRPRRGHRHDRGAGVDTLDAAGGEHDPDGCSRRRAGFLKEKGWANQGRVQEDVGRAAGHLEPTVTDLDSTPGSRSCTLGVKRDEPVHDPRAGPPPLARECFGLRRGPAQDPGQARALTCRTRDAHPAGAANRGMDQPTTTTEAAARESLTRVVSRGLTSSAMRIMPLK